MRSSIETKSIPKLATSTHLPQSFVWIVCALFSSAPFAAAQSPTSNTPWQSLPANGLILDPGSSDFLNAPGPASPFPRRIQQGLPDVQPNATSNESLPSTPISSRVNPIENMPEAGTEPAEEDKKSRAKRRETRERREAQLRLPDSFPRSFLLDPSNPHSDQFTPIAPTDTSTEPSSPWMDLYPELIERLDHCDRLLRTSSSYSAREEVRSGLTLITRRLDQLLKTDQNDSSRKPAIRRSMPHESALQHALRALDEAAFESGQDIDETLQTFADLIPQACLQHPWTADLLYALGKTYERETQVDPSKSDVLRLQAIACYQAAMRIAPNRPYISNQLGFNHLFNNSLDQAFGALQRSLDAQPTYYAWRNLAELYRRRGDHREALLADEQAEYVLAHSPTNEQPSNQLPSNQLPANQLPGSHPRSETPNTNSSTKGSLQPLGRPTQLPLSDLLIKD